MKCAKLILLARNETLCYHRADFKGFVVQVLGDNPSGHFWPGSQYGRVYVSDASSLTSGVAGRYATALFELANEGKSLPAVESDLDALAAAIDESAELRDLLISPIYTREQQGAVMAELSKKMKFGAVVTNTVALMATKRRLFALEAVIAGVKALAADARGEVTAEVTAAKALTKAQQEALAKALKKSVGKDVAINMSVDESIIGGLIVKVGSKMIDTSIASKLSNLQNAMKEVG